MLKRLSFNEESLKRKPGFKYYQKSFRLPGGEDKTFTYRGFSSLEAKRYLAYADELDRQKFALNTVFTEDFDWSILPDGNKDALELSVLKVSGLSSNSNLQEKALSWLKSDEGRLELLTIMTMPGVTLEMLDNCDPGYYQKYCYAAIEVASLNGVNVKEFLGLPDPPPVEQSKEIKNPSIPVVSDDQRKETINRMSFS